MKLTTAMRAITAAYTKLNNCEDMNDLRNLKLTLAEYNAAKDVLQDLTKPHSKTLCFMSGVANFYKNCGFNVALKGVNFQIDTI